MSELPPVEEAPSGIVRAAATAAIAVVPESMAALRAGARVEPCWLDLP